MNLTQSLDNQSLSVNDNINTVIRVVHNRENPFVQLNKGALWDPNLSLKAVGLWARCMSRPNDWKFSIKEITSKCKEGRKAIDSAMQELIDQNYAFRLEYYEKGEDGKFNRRGIEYVFFEFPATEEEKALQLEIFKKSFRDCRFGNLRDGNFRKAHLLRKNDTEIDSTQTESKPSLKVSSPPSPMSAKADDIELDKPHISKNKSDFSPEVYELSQRIIQVMQKFEPDYSPPKNQVGILTHLDFMLRLDKRSPIVIVDILSWALADPFWKPKMFKPNIAKYLRDKYLQLKNQMETKYQDPNKVDRRVKNRDGTPMEAPHLKDLF